MKTKKKWYFISLILLSCIVLSKVDPFSGSLKVQTTPPSQKVPVQKVQPSPFQTNEIDKALYAQVHRRLARYPAYCEPISAEQDPILAKFTVHANQMHSQNQDGPTLYVWPSKTNFVAPEPVIVYAKLVGSNGSLLRGHFEGTIKRNNDVRVTSFYLQDDSSEGEKQTDDPIYTSKIEIPYEPGFNYGGNYLAYIKASSIGPQSEELVAITGFTFSVPTAKLTGNYRDRIENGSLIVEAEVESAAQARYYLEGTLYSQDGSRAIGRTQNAAELGTGITWIPLQFYGLMIHESQLNGPYLLKYVSLGRTGGIPTVPMMRADLVQNAYQTNEFSADQFTNQPFNDSNQLRKAQIIENP